MANFSINFTVAPPVGGGGGTVSILTQRTAKQVAPDAVYFDVDMSAATFDASPAATSADYDPQFHDLDYYWTFGDAGNFQVPLNMPAAWKSKNFAYGKKPAHCFTAPGDYTVTLLVVEPATGKTATAETVITVADPDVVYAGDLTVCVYPVGGSPGTTPTGATLLESDDFVTTNPTHAALVGWAPGGFGRRILFQRGGTYTIGLFLNGAGQNLMFGAYGTGDRPVLNPVTDNSVASGNKCFEIWNRNDATDFRLQSLNCVGNFDPDKGDVVLSKNHDLNTFSGNCIRSLSNLKFVIDDVRAAGFGNSTYIIQASVGEYSFMLFNSEINDFGGQYPTFFNPNTDAASRLCYAGVSMVQKLTSVSDTGNFRAPIRLNAIQSAHMRACDFFHKDHSQPCVKMMETPQKDGTDFHIHTSQFEGNLRVVQVGANIADVNGAAIRSYLINGIVENVIALGTMRTQDMFRLRAGGLTIRNNLIIQPATPPHMNQLSRFFVIQESQTGSGGTPTQPPSDAAYAGPIKIYNNTLVMLRTSAQNSSTTPPDIVSDTPVGVTPLTVVNDNNVLHMPNLDTPSVAFAPLDATPLGWQARNPGLLLPFESFSGTFSSDVANGATFDLTVPDGTIYSAIYSSSRGSAAVTATGATTVTIQNNSGSTWASGSSYTFQLHFTAAGMPADDTSFATPANTIAPYAPLSGSAALGGATTGQIAYRDFYAEVRPATKDKGAFQVSA